MNKGSIKYGGNDLSSPDGYKKQDLLVYKASFELPSEDSVKQII